jgi:hypothetical protein
VGPVSGYLEQRAELREQQARLAELEARRDSFRHQIARLGQAPVLEARARERAFLVRGDLDPAPAAPADEGDDGGALGWLTALF